MCDDQEEEERGSIISSKVSSMMECIVPSNTQEDELSIYSIRILMDDQIKSFPFLCRNESLLEDVGSQIWVGSLLLTDFVLHHKVGLIFSYDVVEYVFRNIRR